MNETDTDLRFYIDLYVDCGFTYDGELFELQSSNYAD